MFTLRNICNYSRRRGKNMVDKGFQSYLPVKIFNHLAPLTALMIVSLTWKHPWVALILLMCLSTYVVLYGEEKKVAFLIWLIATIAGPIAETIAIHFGAWHYTNPTNQMTIPLWLAPCWGLAGLFFLKLSILLEKVKSRD